MSSIAHAKINRKNSYLRFCKSRIKKTEAVKEEKHYFQKKFQIYSYVSLKLKGYIENLSRPVFTGLS